MTRACARADLVVLFTPVTFGGYSSELKKAIDRSLPNLPPIFVRIRGETHHPWRYANRASLAALGVLDQPNEEEQRLFETVVQRNAINFHSPRQAPGVALAADSPERLRDAAAGLLGPCPGKGGPPVSAAPASARRLVILSGSPKPTRSTSAVLGARLAELMAPKGWESVTFRSAAVLASPERWAEFAAAYGAADLIVLSLPLYVDGLPAPLVRVLEKLAPWGTNMGAGPEAGAAPSSPCD